MIERSTSTAKDRPQDNPPVFHNSEDGVGGLTADTEVMTDTGPIKIGDLESNARVYALNPMTGLVKLKSVTDIDIVPNECELVQLRGRGLDFRLHPSHPVLYQTKSIRRPRFVHAESLSEREYYRLINSWGLVRGTPLETVDITDYLERFQARATTTVHGHTFRAALPDGCEPSYVNSHSGYHFDGPTFKRYQSEIESVAEEVSVREYRNQRTHPYRFRGDDLIEFVGWFITEGSTYWSQNRRTVQVKIAQEKPKRRDQIRALFDRLGLPVSEAPRHFTFSSTLFGSLLESTCGIDSRTRHLPEFVWQLSVGQKCLLLDTLLAGDGNEHGTYYTTSERLANGVLRLVLEVGYKPRYTHGKDGCWRVYLSRGNKCFQTSRNVSTVTSQSPLYRPTVQDFSAIMAGRDGRFQWVGTSGVS